MAEPTTEPTTEPTAEPTTEATALSVRFERFSVSDRTVVSLPPSGVVLFVGPNNAGKSQSLRDLLGLAGHPENYSGRAITSVDLEKTGSGPDFLAWITAHVPAVQDDRGLEVRQVGGYGSVPLQQVADVWSQPKLQHLTSLFVFHADATSRLTAGNSVENVNFTRAVASHPLQRAYLDPDLESKIRSASLEAFGVALSVDRYAGNVICLRVGEPPTFEHDNGVPSTEYLKALGELPLLEHQGDGMRSYLGLLLHILGGAHQITLVDEPEAFLHPPQARLLGKTLAKRTIEDQQLFMATHSMDIVQGALDADAPVTIVRVTRDGNVNHAAILDSDQVRELWSDPLLRYSNLLDGLFHDVVVLCEGDADCRYYSSVLDALPRSGGNELGKAYRPPQLLFSHCGGKARMSSVINSLKAISIPVVVIADFDILNDKEVLSRTVASLGGDFSQMETNWNKLNSALTSDVKPVSKAVIREAVEKAIEDVEGENLSKKDVSRIRAVVRIETGWDKVKRGGVSVVPGGEAHTACLELLGQLREIGLLVVPVGELERFVPGVNGHGPSWVAEVHRANLHADPQNHAAREFARKIVAAAARG